jgi:probable rRNA maturation factor
MTKVYLQIASKSAHIPTLTQFKRWINLVLRQQNVKGDISIRIVNKAESAKLNQHYRQKNGATNILSFPLEPIADVPMKLLGDLVICAPIISQEAKQQNKSTLAHWAHITMHGTLHLLGYDHIKDNEADIMENLEITLLRQIDINNPYA